MDKMTSFIHTLVEPLVSHPEDIKITTEDTEEYFVYHLSVNPEDVGRVIGKKGRIAKALRTILYSIHIEDRKRIRLSIDD